MFNLESARLQIKKNELENKILKTQIEFWEVLVSETVLLTFGYTDKWAKNIIEGWCDYPKDASDYEKERIDFYRNKIKKMDKQLFELKW